MSQGTSLFPAGTAVVAGQLAGVINHSCVVLGNVTVTGDLVVNGNLFVTGSFANNGGHAVEVQGDLTVEGAFSCTPTSGLAPQSNVTIWGDFNYGANSDFKVNKGQSPIFKVGGDLRALVFDGNAIEFTFDGTGHPEANGLTIECSGSVYCTSFQLSGGDSAGVAAGGNGGYLNIAGKLLCCDITANGGSSTHSGFDGGTGGTLACESADLNSNSSLNGGSAIATGNINGGAGGTAYINGELLGFEGCQFALIGGDADTGTAGNGGVFTCYGPTTLITLNVGGGDVHTTGTAGNAGSVANSAPMHASALLLTGGGSGAASGQVTGGNGGTATIDGNCDLLALDLRGGRASSSSGPGNNGGNGGSLTIKGDAFIDMNANGDPAYAGGDATGAGTGGKGATLSVEGNLTIRPNGNNPMYFRGGSSSTGGTGGDAGAILVAGRLTITSNSSPLNLVGGSPNVSGTSGNAGVLLCNGLFAGGEIDILDGNVGTAPTGTGKGIALSGACHIGTLAVTNRTGVTISPNGAPTSLQIAVLPGRQVLTNSAGTDTLSVAALLATSIFSYDPTSDAWYKHVGVAL